MITPDCTTYFTAIIEEITRVVRQITWLLSESQLFQQIWLLPLNWLIRSWLGRSQLWSHDHNSGVMDIILRMGLFFQFHHNFEVLLMNNWKLKTINININIKVKGNCDCFFKDPAIYWIVNLLYYNWFLKLCNAFFLMITNIINQRQSCICRNRQNV